MACCGATLSRAQFPRPTRIEQHVLTRRTVPKKNVLALPRAKLDDMKLKSQVVRDDLLGLIAGEERGVRTQKDPQKREKIVKAIEALRDLGAGLTTTDETLTAPWRMVWTTEKESLFILEKAPLFGTQAGDVLQVIDVASGSLQNAILFPPTGRFLVKSTIHPASPQRMDFRFTSASLKIGRWTIPVPPYGKGWFESMYLDEKIRIAKDSRGDYLVCDRAPSVPSLS